MGGRSSLVTLYHMPRFPLSFYARFTLLWLSQHWSEAFVRGFLVSCFSLLSGVRVISFVLAALSEAAMTLLKFINGVPETKPHAKTA